MSQGTNHEIFTKPDSQIDGHVHTRLCHHAVGEMEEYVVAAINKGLKKIFFLEHMEEGIDYFEVTWLTEKDFDYYFTEGHRLRRSYTKDIEIGLGVEVGYNPTHCQELLKRLQMREWDRIGISYHFYKPAGYSQHLNLVSRKKTNVDALALLDVNNILHHYFDTLTEAVDVLPGNVLCHLDAALRFLPNLVYTKNHIEKIKKLLEHIKEQNMALEINTSGIAIRKEPFPTYTIVQMAKELQIPLEAGSDAHSPDNVGRYFSLL